MKGVGEARKPREERAIHKEKTAASGSMGAVGQDATAPAGQPGLGVKV